MMLCVLRTWSLRNTYSVIRIKMPRDTYNKTYDIRMLVNLIRSRGFVLSTVCRYWSDLDEIPKKLEKITIRISYVIQIPVYVFFNNT